MRNIIYNYIIENSDYFRNNKGAIQNNSEIFYTDEYIDFFKYKVNYLRQLEIIETIKFFKIVFEYASKFSGYGFSYNYECERELISYCMILNHIFLNGKI